MAATVHGREHAEVFEEAMREMERNEWADMALYPVCHGCMKQVVECATVDWLDRVLPDGKIKEGHRTQCKDYQNCAADGPEMTRISNQFPWTHPQADGTFNLDVLRVWMKIYGSGREYGYWTEKPCCGNHPKYTRGFLLLEEDHLTDKEGWKLSENLIPWLDHEAFRKGSISAPDPLLLPLHNWLDYYRWRSLPPSSPAALRLHFPLTIYRLLHVLGLDRTSDRRHLKVHLLGVDEILDFLPIFGELTLLLPNTDLDLVLFGPGVSALREEASYRPYCLASRPFAYTYRAPKAAGGGSIRIELARSGPNYLGHDLGPLRSEKPDAILAMNVNPTEDPWYAVVLASRALAIPFAITSTIKTALFIGIRTLFSSLSLARVTLWQAVKMSYPEQRRIDATNVNEFAIELNPFMHPGPEPRSISNGPSSSNAYILVITRRGDPKIDV
ncbi:hypothetical protein H0H93_001937 [Arthromyces matolae]|nr:hypothetical protein H0H93_001937 [Arthromyces matolae]